MTDEYQKELFNEFKTESGKLKKITDKITKKRPKFYLNVPFENIIVAVIVLIMIVIVSFALGVEKGKRLPRLKAPKKAAASIQENTALPEIKLKPIEARIPPATAAETAATEAQISLPYTIQLVSFKQKQIAESEQKKLLSKNINAFIIQSGNWYQVCTGNYKTVKEAEGDLKNLKKDYRGSFVRNK